MENKYILALKFFTETKNEEQMDKVANFVAKKVGAKDCGCNARADKLNELVPFKKKQR